MLRGSIGTFLVHFESLIRPGQEFVNGELAKAQGSGNSKVRRIAITDDMQKLGRSIFTKNIRWPLEQTPHLCGVLLLAYFVCVCRQCTAISQVEIHDRIAVLRPYQITLRQVAEAETNHVTKEVLLAEVQHIKDSGYEFRRVLALIRGLMCC